MEFLPGTWRARVPEAIAADPTLTLGPGLREETTYQVYLRGKSSVEVKLWNRDPVSLQGLHAEENGTLQHGTINFGQQIGHSVFTVLCERRPVCDVEVEVFPSKMDYQTDYVQIMADVQQVMVGLALEYLRATHRFGSALSRSRGTELEWLVILRQIAEELEQAIQQVARRPLRSITRRESTCRIEHLRSVDSVVRASIRRRGVAGAPVRLYDTAECRRHVRATLAYPTLDTAEHRWLASQLRAIVRRLQRLKAMESSRPTTARRKTVLDELSSMEQRMARLCDLEPFQLANSAVPHGFASLSLLGSPGYREAYRCCMVLTYGLRVEGGPLELSVSDLDQLYEQWCYIALLKLTAEETGQAIDAQELVSPMFDGLRVRLERGRQASVPFSLGDGGVVRVTYNPLYDQTMPMLVPQRPDIVMTVRRRDWPEMLLVLDAKYRLDTTEEYVRRYLCPGPPEDALNVLHRYRDAILQSNEEAHEDRGGLHSVVYGAALFPFKDDSSSSCADARYWKSLDSLGVGAIPLLPDNLDYLRTWLRSIVQGGGWALADHTLRHSAVERARRWSRAALDPVLVAPLRGADPGAHLRWICNERLYYIPYAKTQERQLRVRDVAFYSPLSVTEESAVTHRANVESLEICRRSAIRTPWTPTRAPDELQVLYHLGPIRKLTRPILNDREQGKRHSVSGHRWTSRLALERATSIGQLLLTTEPEWRLHEELKAADIDFILRAQRLQRISDTHAVPHACFALPDGSRVQYAGESGFLLQGAAGWRMYENQIDALVRMARELNAVVPVSSRLSLESD